MKQLYKWGLCLAFGNIVLNVGLATEGYETVDLPPMETKNKYYPSNRPPLKPNAFVKLPVGSIKPQGWLLEMLDRQRNGLTGNLGEISEWLQKEDNAWLSKDGKGNRGWEELPYWLKGYAHLGYILEDEAIIKESEIWLNGVINSQRPSGDFGPDQRRHGKRDYWGNMIMLYCLQSYYEYSQDQRVIDLMREYFKYQLTVPDDKFLASYWQKLRGGDNLHSVLWFYNQTGETFALELAEKIHRNTADWSARDLKWNQIMGKKHVRHGIEAPSIYFDLIDWHNVNIAQCFREPATYYQLSGDSKDLQASYDVFRIARDAFGQVPGGMWGGDENSRAGYDDPRQAIETCALVEQMNSNQHMLRITGDSFWADHAETVAFNMLPAALTEDLCALRYLSAPNQPVSDHAKKKDGLDNGYASFYNMTSLSCRCCQHNHAQGWPYYAENLWMATPDNGLLTALYSASTVTAKVGKNGTPVTIQQTTNYPFEETIQLKIASAGAGVFPLYLRIPEWCENARVAVNGIEVNATMAPGKYLRLERNWEKQDRVVMQLPMKIQLDSWVKNHNSVSVNRGPIIYSLRIDERHVHFPGNKHVIFDSKWTEETDVNKWHSTDILPTSPWNYGLVLDQTNPERSFEVVTRDWPANNFPFSLDGTPIVIKAKGRRIKEWALDEANLVEELQDSPAYTTAPTEDITLVPLGAARLRISAFPIASDAADAMRWVEPVNLSKVSRSEKVIIAEMSTGSGMKYAKASHAAQGESPASMFDGKYPKNSADHGVPRMTFWPKKGSSEWIEADFGDKPRTVGNIGIYWFDDSAKGGGCKLPASWSLYYKDGDSWSPVGTTRSYETSKDQYCTLEFSSVNTTALRIKVDLDKGFSAGVIEWKIGE